MLALRVISLIDLRRLVVCLLAAVLFLKRSYLF